jgi:hypothetical protein
MKNNFLKNKKIYYFNAFLNEKYFENQTLSHSETSSKEKRM